MTGAVVAIAIVLIVVGGITASVVAYFRLQRHRADAAAVESYRKLAEEAAVNHSVLQSQLADLTGRVKGIEGLLRSVD
ncbi:hypothetical protein ACFVIM_31620 [Streptomyces sp. NPDC057638]|uniref:hypothetical protein n=1 Tax=Streptomyces sp. NPDC057638 TaxID=3346190 RepID=UPI0036AF66A5